MRNLFFFLTLFSLGLLQAQPTIRWQVGEVRGFVQRHFDETGKAIRKVETHVVARKSLPNGHFLLELSRSCFEAPFSDRTSFRKDPIPFEFKAALEVDVAGRVWRVYEDYDVLGLEKAHLVERPNHLWWDSYPLESLWKEKEPQAPSQPWQLAQETEHQRIYRRGDDEKLWTHRSDGWIHFWQGERMLLRETQGYWVGTYYPNFKFNGPQRPRFAAARHFEDNPSNYQGLDTWQMGQLSGSQKDEPAPHSGEATWHSATAFQQVSLELSPNPRSFFTLYGQYTSLRPYLRETAVWFAGDSLRFTGYQALANRYLNHPLVKPGGQYPALVNVHRWIGSPDHWPKAKAQLDAAYAEALALLDRMGVDPWFAHRQRINLRYRYAYTLLDLAQRHLFDQMEPSEIRDFCQEHLADVPLQHDLADDFFPFWHYLDRYLWLQYSLAHGPSREDGDLLRTVRMYRLMEEHLSGTTRNRAQFDLLYDLLVERKQFSAEIEALCWELEARLSYSSLSNRLKKAREECAVLQPGRPFPRLELYRRRDSARIRLLDSAYLGQKLLIHLYVKPNVADSVAACAAPPDDWLRRVDFEDLVARYPDRKVLHLHLDLFVSGLGLSQANIWQQKVECVRFDDAGGEWLFNLPSFNSYQQVEKQMAWNRREILSETYPVLFLVDERGVIEELIFRSYGPWGAEAQVQRALELEHFQVWGLNWREFSALLTTLGVVLVLTVLFLLLRARYLERREARRRQLTELELRAIRAQLNPHFVFNAMGSIQHLVQAQPERANHYLAELAELMRRVLYHTRQGRIPLSEELETVRRYVALEALRKEVELHIALDDHLEPELIEVPAMLLQPYVENAILHGLLPLRRPGRIEIRIEAGRDRLHLHISDDGVGLHEAQPVASSASGLGLRLTAERLRLLYGPGATVQVYDRGDLEPGQTGTLVSVGLPVQL